MRKLHTTLIAVLLLLLPFAAHPPIPTHAAVDQPDLSLYPLLFKRGNPNPTAGDTAQIIMVGDISLARGVEEATQKNGLDYPFSQVSPWLQAADLAVGNYEGTIAADGIGKMRYMGYRLRAQPEAAPALARAGFDLLNLANNHTVDWGVPSLQATFDNIHAAGIATVGAGPNAAAARKPVVTTVKGIKIVWISYTMVPDPPVYDRDRDNTWTRSWFVPAYDSDQLVRQVKEARLLGDLVIVQFHWGNEYVRCPKDVQIMLARAAIRAGAGLVVGHHPHVVQPYETVDNGFVAYSLGNFVFDQPRTPGLALWIRLNKQGVIDVHGLTLTPGVHPEWQAPAQAAAGLRGLCNLNEPRVTTSFGFSGGQYAKLGTFTEQNALDTCEDRPSSGEIGKIDMKGDGEQERVVLKSGTLHIFEGDHEVYTSYPGWQVVNASLGDPNQDGRFEVMMLLWKQDTPTAPVTTHPFILGYRGGKYQVIWGGSATADWIQDLGVADVDGDSLDELVTIERDPAALACEPRYRVAVTKWNGWGFTRQWISDYGHFDTLRFAPRGETSGQQTILAR